MEGAELFQKPEPSTRRGQARGTSGPQDKSTSIDETLCRSYKLSLASVEMQTLEEARACWLAHVG